MNSSSSIDRTSDRGAVGLHNIGNTCFFNSVVQCLSNTRPLLEYILSQDYVREVKNPTRSILIRRFAELITNLWSGQKGPYSVHSVRNAIIVYTSRFANNNQHDAQELLRYLLEGLHRDLNQVDGEATVSPSGKTIKDKNEELDAERTWQLYLKSDRSIIVDTFGGLLKSILKCKTCGFSSTVFEPFWDLSLSLPVCDANVLTRKPNLNDCLDFFTKEELLDEQEQPTCAKCKVKRICTKRIMIQKFPQILVIHLKRFSNSRLFEKVDCYIDFPVVDLNMSTYSADAKIREAMYDLYGVINHIGSAQFGHYTAYCKNPRIGEWYRFNDRSVSLIGKHMTDKSSAYILFYEKST